MRLIARALILVVASLLAVGPARAHMIEPCPHDATIAALHTCVQHAEHHGFITNAGVARSLHATLDAAAAVQTRGQPAEAVNVLRAFVRQLAAQSGTHIDAEHAAHLRTHAELVIAALAP